MLLISGAREVYLPTGIAKDTSILVDAGRIQDIGPHLKAPGAQRLDATGKTILPGFVDSHTHAVFAGSREFELDMKLQGYSYTDIAAKGGGIGYTVQKTREATPDQLMTQARPPSTFLGLEGLAESVLTLEDGRLRCLQERAVPVWPPVGVAPNGLLAVVPDLLEIKRRQVDAFRLAGLDHEGALRVERGAVTVVLGGGVVRHGNGHGVLESPGLEP